MKTILRNSLLIALLGASINSLTVMNPNLTPQDIETVKGLLAQRANIVVTRTFGTSTMRTTGGDFNEKSIIKLVDGRIAVGATTGIIYIFNLQTNELEMQLQGHLCSIIMLEQDSNGNLISTTQSTKGRWDLSSGEGTVSVTNSTFDLMRDYLNI